MKVQSSAPIDSFSGEFDFLSNFVGRPITLHGKVYPTVEHWYQASKARYSWDHELVRKASSPGKSKKLGRVITIRKNWDSMKLDVMREGLREKFKDSEMRYLLLSTEQRELIEGNWWGDTFWGVCRGVGLNWLGRLLMELRAQIVKEIENV